MGEHKLIMGQDIYFWNFIILMFFTLFEVGAVFFEEYPGTNTRVSMYVVWGILIVVGIIKGFGIGAFFMHGFYREGHRDFVQFHQAYDDMIRYLKNTVIATKHTVIHREWFK